MMLRLSAGFLLALSCAGVLVDAVPRPAFYPFGDEHGDQRLQPGDDVSSPEFLLDTPIAFYDNVYSVVYINVNGHVSFERDNPYYRSDMRMPSPFKMIAPFLADVDTSLSGHVFYRETADPSLLELATREVQTNFPHQYNFEATSLLVVTWEDVGYYQQQYDRTNTFQLVVASDGYASYALFQYADDGVQWTQSQGKAAPSLDIPAQAGFDAGDYSRHTTLPGSGDYGADDYAASSNVGIPGMWVYRIGLTDGTGVEEPAGSYTEEFPPPSHSPRSCAEGGSRLCHEKAACVDHSSGYCCECVSPTYGNGRHCLDPGNAQRLNGKVSGNVNGFEVDSQDLHAYVVTNDGRAYTAMAKLEAAVGVSMQAAYPIGSVVGWLFAKPAADGHKNGYMVTGGDFNRTAVLTYSPGGETLTIKQQFVAEDAMGYMRVSTTLSGNVPDLGLDAKVTVDDYEEEYNRASPGTLKAYSTHTYQVDGAERQFTLEQTIHYHESCSQSASGGEPLASIRVSVMRTFLTYGEREEIVRYAMTNRVTTFSGETDPCRDPGMDCDFNADCLAEGSSYRCQCKQGYEGDGRRCNDVDECYMRIHDCAADAQCYNTEGLFECRCLPGFRGDGRTCVRDQTCADIVCDVHARCVYDADQGRPACECDVGYVGTGVICEAVEFSCNEVNNCDVNAECAFDPVSNSYTCECMDGFSGDGIYCSDGETEFSCRSCDANARCVYDVRVLAFRCQCIEGYSGTGNTCTYIGEHTCDTLNNCDYNAQCIYDTVARAYQCQCNPAYHGDGYRCEPDYPVTEECDILNNCDANAQCTYDATYDRYVCICNSGFAGDGYQCSEEDCSIHNFCDLNAECLYDPYSGRYSCQCMLGYEGDGRYCRQAGDCSLEPSLCDQNAQCTRRGTVYVCVCSAGYRGDGRRCAPEGDSASYLMYAQGMAIMQMPFEASEENPGHQAVMVDGQTAIGIDVDCYSRYFYWTDVSGRTISRAKLDGSDSEVLVKDLGSPEGVAIDWIGKNMYWTDSGLDRIEVSHLDGTSRKTLYDTEIVNPRAIMVDPSRGLMFWTDWNRDAPKIESSFMDGTKRKTIVSEDLRLPNGLTLDYEAEQVCWADAGTQNIECVHYDGRGRRVVYALASYPFGLTYANNVFYWTDWDMKSLPSIDKFGGTTNVPLQLPVGGNGKLYGIATVKEQCPRGSNACVLNNGGCRFLCLPTPNGGRTCVCPDDVPEQECNTVGLFL